MSVIYAVNCQPDTIVLLQESGVSLPVQAIVHDDPQANANDYGLTPFQNAHLDTPHVRLMSDRSEYFSSLPTAQHFVNGNEMDTDWPFWSSLYLQQVRAARPDLHPHHPAPNTGGQYPYDSAIASLCDVIDQHVGISYGNDDPSQPVVFFPEPTPYMFGKPVWITEVEVNPQFPELMAKIPECMAYYANAGYLYIAAWGLDPGFPDVLQHPDILAQIAALPSDPVDPKTRAEIVYNALTGGTPFIADKQYVASYGDGYRLVVTFPDLDSAQKAYNVATCDGVNYGLPFINDIRYTQKNADGTATLVVQYPL